MVGGGGSGNAMAGQNQADAMRMGSRGLRGLERSDWIKLAIAALPLVALVVLGLFLL